ncbi:hypothetical protein SARC_03716 [Sphaeroforma arctica JP610]|uniref:CR-type domain-containing protein n=1 Tax=Sphaeroforma arctica JP610 TaxID=667725 RepID=A0A0L0G558_9EUKA|nr:hypothetical protein SARC_03716 [Sphaeroforma arctica JP610]KNC84054.1 hypothetical protein SARC_03716 [Sphaeroforma arctica JP610]|eukprot:XP_014157956.1 hypothetical protein SARC_03716 [Sphaeroforma arctica JP610]
MSIYPPNFQCPVDLSVTLLISALHLHILSNEKLRQSYDEGNGPAPNDLSFDAEQMLREFEKAFNKEGKIESNRRPVTIPIQLNFLAAVKGCEVDVSYRLKEKCVPCKGSGATAGSPAHVVCSKCGGGGLVMMPAFFILEAHEIDCPKCSGEGVIVPEPCRSCFGRGAEHSTVNKKVQIPPGVVNGQEILLEKSGQAVVMLHVDESSKTFKRKGMDIFSTIEVCALRAALGDVPCNMETVHGTHSVVLPSGTQHGDEVRLAGKGIQSLEADIPPGAHVGVVRIVVPRLLTSSQSERLKKFDAT